MQSLQKVSYYDKRLTEPSSIFGIQRSNAGIMYRASNFTSESNDSGSIDITFNDRSFVNRNLKVKSYIKVTMAGTSASGNLFNLGSTDAPRFQPLNNALWSQVNLDLNGTAITLRNNVIFEPLARFKMAEDNFYDNNSASPSMKDTCQEYTDVIGKVKNPLGDDGVEGSTEGRGAFAGVTVVSNTPTAAVVIFEVIENIFLPSLSYSRSDAPAFVGIDTLNLSITYAKGKELERVLSHNATDGNNITSITVDIGEAASLTKSALLYETISQPSLYQLNLDESRKYPYSPLSYNNKLLGTVTAGSSLTATLDTISTSFIPDRIYLWIRDKVGTRDSTYSDSYGVITNLGLEFGGVTTSISSADKEQLYEISVRNGLKMSYSDFSKNVGSVICLKSGVDFQLPNPDSEAPGLSVKYNYQFTVTVKNPSAISRSYEACLVTVNSGYLEIKEKKITLQTNILKAEEIIMTPVDQKTMAPDQSREIYAGSVFSDVEDVIQKGMQFGQAVAKTGKSIAPLLGLGMLEAPQMGGAMMSRGKLSSRFKK